jgi:hypothetical protein
LLHDVQAFQAVLNSEAAMREQVLPEATGYEIRFCSLFNEGRALSFPCDREGHVDLDALSQKALGNYLFARAMVGREFASPSVMERAPH